MLIYILLYVILLLSEIILSLIFSASGDGFTAYVIDFAWLTALADTSK
jgi:hypothetical protein